MRQQVHHDIKHRNAYEENVLDVRQRKSPHVFPQAISGYYEIRVSLSCVVGQAELLTYEEQKTP